MAETHSVSFHACVGKPLHLFEVRAGIPVAEALDDAYAVLDIATGLATQVPDASSTDKEWLAFACSFLIDMAMATVRACHEGLSAKEARHD